MERAMITNRAKRMKRSLSLVLALAISALAAAPVRAADPAPAPAFAMRGTPKYGADFSHFDYVRADAPKGGNIVLAEPGTFDSLNPFILKGVPADVVTSGTNFEPGATVDTLMVPAQDEPATVYGLIAKTITAPADRSWAEFEINPEARFHDGSPITAEDVVWTFETLITKGHPTWRLRFGDVEKAEARGPRTVRFTFKPGDNFQLPIMVAGLPVLSKAYYSKANFDETTLDPPLGNGPYKITKVDPGKSITMERVKDYWAKDLPVNRGRYNFDRVRTDYYRDLTVWLEALKAGQYDLKTENSSKDWATAYDTPAVTSGQIVRELIHNESPQMLQGWAYNLRRPLFADPRVREALGYALDFEWMNRTLFYGIYSRTRSYFPNSEMEAKGLPSPDELTLLEPYRGKIPDAVFTQEYEPPKTDGSGNLRANLGAALKLLGDAGWSVKNNQLVNKEGAQFSFEILLEDASFERLALPFVQNLKRLGIDAHVRTIDPSQYQHRIEDFDFDMSLCIFFETLSPGNELRDYFGSRSTDTTGGQNIIGIKNPAVDDLIEQVINAPDQPSLLTRTHALDRMLQWGFYQIPLMYRADNRVAYWNIFGHPEHFPPFLNSSVDIVFSSWWYDPAKAAAITMRSRTE
jgi:microcin C transport system substrate-binding protein